MNVARKCLRLCSVSQSKLCVSHKGSCIQRLLHSAGSIKSTIEFSNAQLEKNRSLERHFKRRLRAAHQRFPDLPDSGMVQGCRHVYVDDGGAIYRMADGHEQDVVEVLHAEWAGDAVGTIQRVRLSPAERVLAATVKTAHNEEAKCMLVQLDDINTSQKPLLILDQVFSFEWATDDLLFYTTQEGLQCRKVFRLHLCQSGAKSSLVYEEKDPEFFVEVSRTRDQRLVTINCSSKASSEVWMIDSSAPWAPPVLVQRRMTGLLYHVEHSDGQLYVLANTGPEQEYQLLRAPVGTPAMPSWAPVYRAPRGALIKDMEMLREHCVFTVSQPGGPLLLQTLPVQDPSRVSTLQLPDWACNIETGRVSVKDRETVSFILSSPVHPPIRYLCSPTEHQPLSQEGGPLGGPPQDCHITRLQATSQDGTQVPMTLFHSAVLAELGGAPLLVHVYGAYGLDLNMEFCPEKRMLLEDGWALAYCHVRGGGERGLAWHRAGRLQGKRRGLEDLEACLHTLFCAGVSQPALCAVTARSAGAVLATALCNQDPHLIRALSLKAPFLDVLGAMQDSSLPLTVEERGEWGDPLEDPQMRDCIASYCPCHNIKPQRYPSVLITAYSDDKRVALSGVLKYVERLRKATNTHTCSLTAPEPARPIVFDLQPGGDHFGPDTLDLSLSECGRHLAFIHAELGLDVPGHKRRRRR